MSIESSRPERLLLVDDEDAVRVVVAAMLRRAGFDVLEAASGDEALKLFDAHSAEIRILVSDVAMPGMRGPALAQRLIGVQPALSVLFISGYAEWLPSTVLNHPRMAFVGKPFGAAELVAQLRELIDRPSPVVASDSQVRR